MNKKEALVLVCETAYEWAGEYGFSDPTGAKIVIEAAELLHPYRVTYDGHVHPKKSKAESKEDSTEWKQWWDNV